MARYMNGTIRPSQAESVSDRLRGVRSGYLLDGGTPVTGNYMDAISDQLRAGFGPPPTPSVGYAATAEYVYPSQKMVTGAALAGQMLREGLKTSYSSPASEYHSGLRALRGLGATADALSCKVTVQAGDGPYQVEQALKAQGISMSRREILSVIQKNGMIRVGTYDIPQRFCPPATGGGTPQPPATPGGGDPGDTGSLPADIAAVLRALQQEKVIDGEDVTDYAQRLISEEFDALAAYAKATQQQKDAYKVCVREEAAKFLPTDFSNCRDRVGIAAGPGLLDVLKDAAAVVGAVSAEGMKLAIDAGIQKLQSAGRAVPDVCKTSKYTAGCAGAVLAAVDALDKQTGGNSNERLPGFVSVSSDSDNTGLFIGLGVAAIAVIGILAVVMSKKQSEPAA